MLNQTKTLEALAFSLSFILFFISILMAYELGDLVIDTAAVSSMAIIVTIMVLFYALQPVFMKYWHPLQLYLASFTLTFLLFLTVAFAAFPQFFMLVSSLGLFLIYYVLSIRDTGDLKVRVLLWP
jgi:hypothetical protein